MSTIKFINQISPNGKTFCIADANDIIGGLHYAANLDELLKIHKSRLVHGTLCYVQSENKNYVYVIDDGIGSWKVFNSGEGGDNIFNCTTTGISSNTKMTGTIGNLKNLTKGELESLTINDILTRALFSEELPSIYYEKPSLTLKSYEVGTEVGISIKVDADYIKPGYLSYAYTTDNLSDVSYGYSLKSIGLSSYVNKPYIVNFGENQNIGVTNWVLDADDDILEKLTLLKGKTLNDGELIVTSWGRTINEYNQDNNTVETRSLSKDVYTNENVYYPIYGYYIVRYYEGNTIEDAVKLDDDYNNAKTNFNKLTAWDTYITNNLTGDNTITLTTDKTTNSAFVYVFVPNGYKIKDAKIKNGLNNNYENTPFGLVADGLTPNTKSETKIFNNYYTSNIYYIAKGDPNNEECVSPASEPIQITIIKES